MEKLLTKYSDGSFVYRHICTRCNENTYEGRKGKTNGLCHSCLKEHRVEAGRRASQAKRSNKLLSKVSNTKLAQEGLSKEALQEIFNYEVEGVLTWKDTFGPKMQKGALAGSYSSNGYRMVSFNNTKYLVHRLIYIYHYGTEGLDQIDHIDRDSTNNRIENLRNVSHAENMQNTLPKGYVFDPAINKYIVRIRKDNKTKHIGKYSTKEEAQEAYYRAKQKYHIKEEE
jgi:hypothetical protein